MITLKNTKIFYNNQFKPKSKKYIYKEVDNIIPYLSDSIEIKEGTTLLDFFKVIEKDKEMFEIIFSSYLGHFPLEPYIKEIKKDCPLESKEDLDCIECAWGTDQFDYGLFYEKNKNNKNVIKNFGNLRKPDNEINEIDIYVDVRGLGKSNLTPEEEKYSGIIVDDNGLISYGIEFLPLYRIAHLPLKLNKEFIINKKNMGYGNPVIQGEKEFNVFEVFGAIFNELTFCGFPKDRNEELKTIEDDMEEQNENDKDKN